MHSQLSSRALLPIALAVALVAGRAGAAPGSSDARPPVDKKGLSFGDYDIYSDFDPTVPLLVKVQAAPSSTVWTDVTTSALACTTYAADKKGVAFIDYDVDGDLDICAVAEGQHAINLFRNDAGSFTDVTAAPLLVWGSGSSQTWGDFDNDGDPDLAMFTEEASPFLFRNDGGGSFANVTPPVFQVPAHGHSASWVDFDRDSYLDLYVANMGRNAPTLSRLFRRSGPGEFADATADSLGVRGGDGVAWGDYDNDGDPDVFLARFLHMQDLLLRNDGGTFVDVTAGALMDALHGHSCAWADFDNDLDLDLFVANANGPNRLYRNDNGTFVNATPPPMVVGIHSVGMVWGDYDNDGWLDMFLTLTDEGQSRMFHNDGGGVFSQEAAGPLSGTGTMAAAACGDYDQDGDLDLYVSSYLHRANKLFRNDLTNGNHWIEVDLEGTVSNRSGIGARVYVEAGGQWQMRELAACTGYRSQSSLTAHFGLGTNTMVDRVRVQWPSGAVQQTTLVAADQRIRIVESPSSDVAPTAESHLALGAAAPNPFAVSTRVAYQLPAAGSVRLDILDLAGRVVRSLEGGGGTAGRHERTWDGRDDAGRRVNDGVYFMRLETPLGSAQRRVVMLAR